MATGSSLSLGPYLPEPSPRAATSPRLILPTDRREAPPGRGRGLLDCHCGSITYVSGYCFANRASAQATVEQTIAADDQRASPLGFSRRPLGTVRERPSDGPLRIARRGSHARPGTRPPAGCNWHRVNLHLRNAPRVIPRSRVNRQLQEVQSGRQDLNLRPPGPQPEGSGCVGAESAVWSGFESP